MDKYQLLLDAYYGEGGFADGSYIVKHKRELSENLTIRKNISYFLNYTAPVVNSHVDPVFSKVQTRDWSGSNAFIEDFVQDTNGSGTPLKQFMKNAALTAKLLGSCFIVLDNVKADEQPMRRSEAMERRVFPYAYIVSPQDVFEVKYDKYGALALFSGSEKGEDGADLVRTWTPTEWTLSKVEEGQRNDGAKQFTVIERGTHGLGVVPVVPLFARKRIGRIPQGDLGQSEMFHIAKTNLRIFNLCSELDEILRNQAFAILIYPSKSPSDLTIGTNNALGFEGDKVHHPPAFIAPPSEPAQLLMAHIDRLVKEIYRMATLSHVTGVQENRSGVAKQWDFQSTNQVLADFAANCQEAENRLGVLFALYTRTPNLGYRAVYATDYSIRETTEYLANAARTLDMDLGAMFEAAVKEQVAGVMLQDLPGDKFDEIVGQIREIGEDRENAESIMDDDAGTQTQYAITGLLDLLKAVASGEVAEEAAVLALSGTFGYTDEAARRMVAAQKGAEVSEME